AGEAPDEFTRRAAMGEHAFLQVARREPAGARVSVALFDGGPNQLGAPRLVHLAALIVLARRAEVAGAPFAWGVAQQPAGPLFTTVTGATLMRLLDARGPYEGRDVDLEVWRRRLAGTKQADD